jgi:hypothetical protein
MNKLSFYIQDYVPGLDACFLCRRIWCYRMHHESVAGKEGYGQRKKNAEENKGQKDVDQRTGSIDS